MPTLLFTVRVFVVCASVLVPVPLALSVTMLLLASFTTVPVARNWAAVITSIMSTSLTVAALIKISSPWLCI